MNLPNHCPPPLNRRHALRLAWATALAAGSVRASPVPAMKLLLKLGDHRLDLLLDDHPTARDFAALLPLRLTLEDYAATEKIAVLPRALTTEGAPAGYAPMAGDMAYYAPWGNVALFHKDFQHSPGLVRLGRLTQGVQRLAMPGRVVAEWTLAAP